MKLRLRLVVRSVLFGCLVLLALAVAAEDGASSTAPPVAATIDDFAWLTGHWLGEDNSEESGEEELIEETWGVARNGLILGMYRQDSPRQAFYELFTLAETEEGSVELRIKHFNPGLVAWEEKEESVRFALVKVEENHATFVDEKGTRLVYDREGDLFIAALESDKDGETRRFEFRFRLAPF